MLRRTMNASLSIRLGLEDLLADLRHARRHAELGRLALLSYCEVRGWARQAGEIGIASQSTKMFTENPYVNKEDFLMKVDSLISSLERLQSSAPASSRSFAPAQGGGTPFAQSH